MKVRLINAPIDSDGDFLYWYDSSHVGKIFEVRHEPVQKDSEYSSNLRGIKVKSHILAFPVEDVPGFAWKSCWIDDCDFVVVQQKLEIKVKNGKIQWTLSPSE